MARRETRVRVRTHLSVGSQEWHAYVTDVDAHRRPTRRAALEALAKALQEALDAVRAEIAEEDAPTKPPRAHVEAEDFRSLVAKRTGLAGKDLQCPREKSAMTPCVARDGCLAVTDDGLCAGCERRVSDLYAAEIAKGVPGGGT